MKCLHCGTENTFYLSRTYQGHEAFTIKEIGKDEDGNPYAVMELGRSLEDYLGVEEECLRCESCNLIVLHDDEFSLYRKTWE